MTEQPVNAIWRYLAVAAISALVGATPSYIKMIFAPQMSMSDVDHEIDLRNAPIVTSLNDLKDQVHEENGRIDEVLKLANKK